MYKDKLEFPEGWAVLDKISSVGRDGFIFSGTKSGLMYGLKTHIGQILILVSRHKIKEELIK